MKHFKRAALVFLVLIPAVALADWKSSFTAALRNGGALVVDRNGDVLYQHRANDHFIPASTIKVATAAAAVRKLGRDFRFHTDFFVDGGGRLVMKGYGDPFLVSEEFPRIVSGLKAKGLKSVSGIVVDGGYFDPGVDIDGSSRSTNPYDAVNGALIANFNTINTRKSGGKIVSAEAQTPMTPIAEAAARKFGGARVNLGKERDIGARYAGEILAAFLAKDGVPVSGGVEAGRAPAGAEPFYRHVSSKTLEDNLKGLLEFSTNFISNQLFLFLGAHELGGPATVQKGLQVLKGFLAKEVGWKDFQLAEGAGLSRQNSVTPLQMMTLLNYFEKDFDLLPVKEGVLHAKTGTLTGVNTLVGYFDGKGGRVKFVILVNDGVPFDYKFRLGKMVYDGVNGN